MVATRRGAHTGPSEEPEIQEPSMMLRKKPVRRATARTTKAAQAALSAATARGRATRSKDQEIAPTDDATDTTDGDTPAKQHKPATKRATRSRKAENTVPEQSEVSEVEQPAPKAQRGRKKAAAEASEPLPDVDDEPTPKPSLASRPTRPTRTTGTASKPLSPKKITQVTKPRTRNAKSTEAEKQKRPAKTMSIDSVRTARTTRKRAVSDENAEVPELMPTDTEEPEAIEPLPLPAKIASPRKPSRSKQREEESEGAMSSRGTTPSNTPGPTFDQPKDYTEDNIDGQVSEHEIGESNAPQLSGSEDELCGAKTPMKRSIHHCGPKFYSSAQKTAKRVDVDVPADTPPRRYRAHGRARATPQTQKPVTRAADKAFRKAPNTVARGNGRAFERESEDKSEDAAEPSNETTIVGKEAETSIINNEPTIAVQESSEEEQVELMTADVAAEEPQYQSDGEDENVQIAIGSPASEQADAEETILVSDDDSDAEVIEDSPTVQQPVSQGEVDNQAIVIDDDEEQDITSSEDEDLEDSLFAFNPNTPRPETINWQNLRRDATIEVDFDFHLADARSPPKDGSTPGMTSFAVEQQAKAGSEENVDDSIGDMTIPDQPTMTLNDFIDVAALAEPTLKLDAPVGETNAAGSIVDDTACEDDSDEVGDANTIVTEKPAANLEEANSPTREASSHLEVHQSSPEPQDEIDVLATSPSPTPGATNDQQGEGAPDAQPQDDGETQLSSPDNPEGNRAYTETSHVPVPHYAFPTLASRRKSLPATGFQTPTKSASRPNTSDGASIARLSRPFDLSFWLGRDQVQSNASAAVTPVRPATAGTWSERKVANSAKDAADPASAPHRTPVAIPRERFPRLAARENYEDLSQTMGAPARLHTPGAVSMRRPATVQRMASQQNSSPATPRVPVTPTAASSSRVLRSAQHNTSGGQAQTAAAPTRFRTSVTKFAQRPATVQRLASQATPKASSPARPASTRKSPAKSSSAKATPKAASPATVSSTTVTPVPAAGARYPKLAPKSNYEEHASTVAAPSRFRTPGQTAMKRPSTTQKPTEMRRVAFQPSTPRGSHTPVKTPLKAPDMTPGNVPMTPHPAAPLRGVTALVEVFTLDGASASAPFTALLRRLGARTTKTWSDRVTHVVFKDGSPTTLQRVRLHNKDVESARKGEPVHCVNSRWVSDCDADGSRVDETDEAYAVDVTDVPRGGSRRRKSMEPNALINLGGNVVRDRKSSFSRKNSIGRSSLGRSPLKFDSPEKKTKLLNTPVFGKENYEDLDDDDFATPEYLKSPGKLVQQTAPTNRVKNLDLKAGKAEEKNRRLTFWSGGN